MPDHSCMSDVKPFHCRMLGALSHTGLGCLHKYNSISVSENYSVSTYHWRPDAPSHMSCLWFAGRRMTFRYIGSKARLVDQISAHVGSPTGGVFVDAFCGTGVVAESAANAGWSVRLNDQLASATISAAARLVSAAEAPFSALGGYAAAVDTLNTLPPICGFIWRTYSPASIQFSAFERRYFSEVNAGRIDAIRLQIRQWNEESRISPLEERLLIGDLFSALNRVANIAGTFGCYLAKWTAQSNEKLVVRARELKEKSANLEVSTGDVFDMKVGAQDVVYLDPPYTKRQYASYYHILETVAQGDEPEVEGVAGLRPWRDRSSDFCYKTRALKTLERLVDTLPCRRVLLSYSSQGHIPIDQLQSSLHRIGKTALFPLGEIGRYRPNAGASRAGTDVTEFLVVVEKQLGEFPDIKWANAL